MTHSGALTPEPIIGSGIQDLLLLKALCKFVLNRTINEVSIMAANAKIANFGPLRDHYSGTIWKGSGQFSKETEILSKYNLCASLIKVDRNMWSLSCTQVGIWPIFEQNRDILPMQVVCEFVKID